MSEHENMDVCGLEGEPKRPPTRAEVNRFIRRAMTYHVAPMKKDLSDVKEITFSIRETIDKHMEADRIFFAKLSGAKYVLWGISALLMSILAVMGYILQALKLFGS